MSLDLAVASDVPAAAGLSSSAALEVATALAVAGVLEIPLSLEQAAMTAWRAETGFVGVSCGIMDQFASALCRAGEALHLECDTARYDFAPVEGCVLLEAGHAADALATVRAAAQPDVSTQRLEMQWSKHYAALLAQLHVEARP